jgi:hypothetical protein
MSTPDPTMDRIVTAVAARDRDDLLALWSTSDLSRLHRCVVAHHLADMHDAAADALVWDERALAAADEIDAESLDDVAPGVQVAALYPSLHLNIADDLRQLASFDDSAAHLEKARAALSSLDELGPDHAPYVAMLRDLVDDIEAMVRSRSTGRRDTAPG